MATTACSHARVRVLHILSVLPHHRYDEMMVTETGVEKEETKTIDTERASLSLIDRHRSTMRCQCLIYRESSNQERPGSTVVETEQVQVQGEAGGTSRMVGSRF